MGDTFFVKFSKFDASFGQMDKCSDKFVVDVLMDEDPRRLTTELTRIHKAPCKNIANSRTKVCIFTDDQWIFAAQLQVESLKSER